MCHFRILFQNMDRLPHLSRKGPFNDVLHTFSSFLIYVYAHTGTCAPMWKSEDNFKVIFPEPGAHQLGQTGWSVSTRDSSWPLSTEITGARYQTWHFYVCSGVLPRCLMFARQTLYQLSCHPKPFLLYCKTEIYSSKPGEPTFDPCVQTGSKCPGDI